MDAPSDLRARDHVPLPSPGIPCLEHLASSSSPRLRLREQCCSNAPAHSLLHVLALSLCDSHARTPKLTIHLGHTCDRCAHHLRAENSATAQTPLPPPSKWIPTAPQSIPHPRFAHTLFSRPTLTPTSTSTPRHSPRRARTSLPQQRPPSPRRPSQHTTSLRATSLRHRQRTRIARSSQSVRAAIRS